MSCCPPIGSFLFSKPRDTARQTRQRYETKNRLSMQHATWYPFVAVHPTTTPNSPPSPGRGWPAFLKSNDQIKNHGRWRVETQTNETLKLKCILARSCIKMVLTTHTRYTGTGESNVAASHRYSQGLAGARGELRLPCGLQLRVVAVAH